MTIGNALTRLNKMINQSNENQEYFENMGDLETASFNIGVAFGCGYAVMLLEEVEKDLPKEEYFDPLSLA